MTSAAVTAVDVVRGAGSRAADSERARAGVVLLQLEASEYVGNASGATAALRRTRRPKPL